MSLPTDLVRSLILPDPRLKDIGFGIIVAPSSSAFLNCLHFRWNSCTPMYLDDKIILVMLFASQLHASPRWGIESPLPALQSPIQTQRNIANLPARFLGRHSCLRVNLPLPSGLLKCSRKLDIAIKFILAIRNAVGIYNRIGSLLRGGRDSPSLGEVEKDRKSCTGYFWHGDVSCQDTSRK